MLTVNLPTGSASAAYIQTIAVYFQTGSSTPTINIVPATVSGSRQSLSWYKTPSFDSGKTYELNLQWNGTKWVGAYAVIE